jgi:hypothetical protein
MKLGCISLRIAEDIRKYRSAEGGDAPDIRWHSEVPRTLLTGPSKARQIQETEEDFV